MKLKSRLSLIFGFWSMFFLCFNFLISGVLAQEPIPAAPKSVIIPAIKEKTLANGLIVAVVERKNVPLVTVSLLIRSGAASESYAQAGLADMTASLLTKGTKTRSATQIAEQIEFLGGSISSGAGWNNTTVTINVMSDKIEQALAIMADVVMNPAFSQKEIELYKSQALDGLAYNLKQPGFLANYVSSVYSFKEHPAGGTPGSIKQIKRAEIVKFKNENFLPTNSVMIFAGDISAAKANQLAQKFFGIWKKPPAKSSVDEKTIIDDGNTVTPANSQSSSAVNNILVVDLPNSGQAAVNYVKPLRLNGRIKCNSPGKCQSSPIFYPASVMNSILGGGYSSRLNQEIRIKRGLSYGAGSGFSWRGQSTNFGTRTQTKNESAAEVAELILAEIQKLIEADVTEKEISPRKSVVTGDFGRNLETNGGLAEAVAGLYAFQLPVVELNSFMPAVQNVSALQVRQFANSYLKGGDLVIVGDYEKFKDDLAKRFPGIKPQIIKADNLDLQKLPK